MSYRTGFVKRPGEAGRLPAITIEADDLPEDVLALLDAHLLDLRRTYGDPNADGPVQTMSGDNQSVLDGFTTEHECPPRLPSVPEDSLDQCRDTGFVLDLGTR